MENISINEFQLVTSASGAYILLSLGDGQGGRIAASTFTEQIKPSIQNGVWFIGSQSTGVTAQGEDGKSVRLRQGSTGIEWAHVDEENWKVIVPYSDLKLDFDDLTEEQKAQLKMTLDDLSEEDIALLQQPARDMIATLQAANVEMQAAKNDAQDTADHPTYIGIDYYVYKWNKTSKVYEKTDIYVKGEQGEQGEQGIQGEQGQQGAQGEQGQKGEDGLPPTLQLGYVTTLEAGANASAKITPNGTTADGSPIYKIDLFLPRGDKGENGSGSGNVLVDASQLVKGKQYVFTPNQDGSAEGRFEEVIVPEIDTTNLATKNDLNGKQDKIADLEAIRQGASKGATALQSVPSEYAKKTEVPTKVSELPNDAYYTSAGEAVDEIESPEFANVTIAHTTGQDENTVMSQKAVTEKFEEVERDVKTLSGNLNSIVDIKTNDYASTMDWAILNNNNQNTTNYVTDVIKEDDKILMYPSGTGTNFGVSIYIGQPAEGEIVSIQMKVAHATSPNIRKNVTPTNHGIEIHSLTLEDGVYSVKFKADGSPIYLFFLVLYSASPTKPVEISDCKLVGNKATIEGDFATKNDLIKNNLMLLPKAEKSYNPVNGALENTSVRFGTGLVKVNEGLVLKTEGVDKPYIVYFDDTLKYTGYRRPHVEPEYNGVFDIPAGTSYIAITSNTDFVACYITKIDVNGQHIFPVEYKDEDFQPYSQVPRLLRKNGVMVSYTLPSGENVIEVFKDPGNIDLTSNHFGVQQHWKRLAYTDIVDGIHQHPMKGKTFYSIGDSHRWKWNELLANLTGSVAGGDLLAFITNKDNKVRAIDGDESSALVSYEDKYVSRCVSMAKRLVDLYKSGEKVDYIFLEYVHKYFTNDLPPSNTYDYSGDITQAEPFLTQAFYIYEGTTFNTDVEAKNYWESNYQNIVSGFSPVSNAIVALKAVTKQQSQKFKLSSGTTTSGGDFIVSFTDNAGKVYSVNVYISAGMTLNEALTEINAMSFVSQTGCKWTNKNSHSAVNNATLVYSYTGDKKDADASIKMSFNGTTTGIVLDGSFSIEDSIFYVTRGFKSHDVSEWANKSKWKDLYANVDAYIWIKATVELLQREIPTAKIFVWTLCTEEWNYANNTIDGKSVLYPDGTLNVQAIYDSDKHKRMVQNLDGWKTVAEYYHLGFIPISEMNSISPANHKYYYSSDDVHPTQEGYDRVAEILASKVY